MANGSAKEDKYETGRSNIRESYRRAGVTNPYKNAPYLTPEEIKKMKKKDRENMKKEKKNKEQHCRTCHHFVYQIHHASYCELGQKKGAKELRDGRVLACEKFKLKKKKKRVA